MLPISDLKNQTIPVEFTFNGKLYRGTLSFVTGAAAYTWSLNVNGYYWATFNYTETYGLRLGHFNKPGLDALESYFVDVIVAWNG